MWSKRWFRRGILLALIPLGAVACHHRGHGHHELSDAELRERLEDGTEDVMDYVDATPEQVTRAKAVVTATAADMKSFRAEHKVLRDEFQQALSVPQVDRDQLEGLRVNALDLADRASTRLLTAIADVADILTVSQRQKLVSKWKRYRG